MTSDPHSGAQSTLIDAIMALQSGDYAILITHTADGLGSKIIGAGRDDPGRFVLTIEAIKAMHIIGFMRLQKGPKE